MSKVISSSNLSEFEAVVIRFQKIAFSLKHINLLLDDPDIKGTFDEGILLSLLQDVSDELNLATSYLYDFYNCVYSEKNILTSDCYISALFAWRKV